MVGRYLRLLEKWELKAFDQMVRLRGATDADDRIFVVTVDEEDIQYQQKMGMNMRGSLSDGALAQLLGKLTPHQPRVIASDIFHDFPFQPDLATTICNQLLEFIGICTVGNSS